MVVVDETPSRREWPCAVAVDGLAAVSSITTVGGAARGGACWP